MDVDLYWAGPGPSADGRGQFTSHGTPARGPHLVNLCVRPGRVVGRVMWHCWPQLGDYRWRFFWSCDLPGATALSPKEATETRTYVQANAELLREVRAWFRAASPPDTGETLETAVDWCDETFGPLYGPTPLDHYRFLLEEVAELGLALDVPEAAVTETLAAVYARVGHTRGDASLIDEELGDTQLNLGCLARALGRSLMGCVRAKMELNRSRPPAYYAHKRERKRAAGQVPQEG